MSLSTELLVTTMVVAITISSPPTISCADIVCPRKATLRITAVTGSKAPNIAVGVEPIICMAADVQANDNTVGIMANAMRLYHPVDLTGNVNSVPIAILNKNTVLPKINT